MLVFVEKFGQKYDFQGEMPLVESGGEGMVWTQRKKVLTDY